MAKTARIDRLCVVIVSVVTFGVWPPAAYAQLRSLHAIRYVTLAPPPPGMEKLHTDLADLWRQQTKLVEAPETLDERLARGETFETYPALWIEPRARAARCGLRTDLSQPRTIGLECSDYAGKHVGVVRFSTADELRRWVNLAGQFNLAAARPLTTVRGLVSGQTRRRGVSIKHVEFVKALLRADGKFAVLDSDEDVPGNVRESLVWFDLDPNSFIVNGTSIARLNLTDRFGNGVRRFEVERSRSIETALRRLVDQLLRARLEDEEIYRMPPLN